MNPDLDSDRLTGTDQNVLGKPSLNNPCRGQDSLASDGANRSAHCFVLIIRPGKAHDTKGPFECRNVCPMLRSARALYPDAVLSVCEVTDAGALWATSENEWLHMMCTPNGKVSDAAH